MSSPVRGAFNQRVRVRVPATSANLGPGFDACGIALDLFDEVVVEVSDKPGVRVNVTGEGAEEVPRDHRHLVARTMEQVFSRYEIRPPGLLLNCRNEIPQGRGLGSSAGARVAGLLAARAILGSLAADFTDEKLLSWASRLENHPDNAVACLLGGFGLGWRVGDEADTAEPEFAGISLPVHPDIHPLVAIPRSQTFTEKARAQLPATVPFTDAVENLTRSALLSVALTSQPDLLFPATQDRLHQHYRVDSYPDTVALVQAARAQQLPTVISGAGSSVLAFAVRDVARIQADFAVLAQQYLPQAQVRVLAVNTTGAQVEVG